MRRNDALLCRNKGNHGGEPQDKAQDGKVQIFTYVTERTFDSYSYQILENKQRFISQINKGDLAVREADDIDETTLSYAEIKAITASQSQDKAENGS